MRIQDKQCEFGRPVVGGRSRLLSCDVPERGITFETRWRSISVDALGRLLFAILRDDPRVHRRAAKIGAGRQSGLKSRRCQSPRRRRPSR